MKRLVMLVLAAGLSGPVGANESDERIWAALVAVEEGQDQQDSVMILGGLTALTQLGVGDATDADPGFLATARLKAMLWARGKEDLIRRLAATELQAPHRYLRPVDPDGAGQADAMCRDVGRYLQRCGPDLVVLDIHGDRRFLVFETSQ